MGEAVDVVDSDEDGGVGSCGMAIDSNEFELLDVDVLLLAVFSLLLLLLLLLLLFKLLLLLLLMLMLLLTETLLLLLLLTVNEGIDVDDLAVGQCGRANCSMLKGLFLGG